MTWRRSDNGIDLAAHPALTNPGTFVAIVGPSGAGKDSVVRGVRQGLAGDGRIVFARRVITRPPEPNEDHEAVSDSEFNARASAGAFAIAWTAHDLSYGLSMQIVDQIYAGRAVVANVSRHILPALHDLLPRVFVVSIEARPDILAQRLAFRERETADQQAQRLARPSPAYEADVHIDNGGALQSAVRQLESVLRSTVETQNANVPRFGIYLAPPPGSPLWERASSVIGYDASTGRRLSTFTPPTVNASDWSAATRAPRTYGFHATLKAPFRLTPAFTPGDLDAALQDYASKVSAFNLGPLVLRRIGKSSAQSFLALVPANPSEALSALEHYVVEHFDCFRAPMTDAEIRRRKPETLTPRQRELLHQFGYPYVHDEFRCHFSLSGPLSPEFNSTDAIERAFTGVSGIDAFAVDALVLFAQPAPDAPFRVLRRYALSA